MISIVIPSYNKAQYISQTLDSIFHQNYPDLEVIIQDGGSTDGTLQIIKKYARKYPKIISWVSRRDGGQLDAINTGLAKTKGDILTFINADDVYTDNAFSLVSQAFSRQPGLLWVAGQCGIINETNQPTFSFVTAYKNILLRLNKYFLLLTVNYLCQPSVFFSRTAYRKHGPFIGVSRIVMEYDFWLKLGRVRMPFVINQDLSRFRLARGSFSTSSSGRLLNTDQEISQKYSRDPLILLLHRLHNLLRLLLLKFV